MNESRRTSDEAVPLWQPLLHGTQRVESRLEALLAPEGLSLSKLGLLRAIALNGEPLPLSRLAGALACVKSNVTQLVDRLEADGLVRRVPDPSDRRSILAEITEEGRRRYEAGARVVAEAEREIFGALAPEDRERLARLLDALAKTECGERA